MVGKGIDLGLLGIPTLAEYKESYIQGMGWKTPSHWDFFVVFTLFKYGAAFEGVLTRFRKGKTFIKYFVFVLNPLNA